MYVTRHLSLYRRSPESLSLPTPEGPNSGYLVLFDQESETFTCLGCKDTDIRDLPFPQNKNLIIDYGSATGTESPTNDYEDVIFIPVLNQPLLSNRYYVIMRKGNHRGEASTSSKEEDVTTGCCCTYISDVKPRPLNPLDECQQFEIICKKHRGFKAKSVASDGIPSQLLRPKYWQVSMRTPRNYQLQDASGLDPSLRKRLPEFNNFSLSNGSSENVVVGKWYCPFMFVHEDLKLKDQIKISTFYEVTLEQRWHKIFSCDNAGSDQRKVVLVDVSVQKEEVSINGGRAANVGEAKNGVKNGVMWFKSCDSGEETKVGLSMLVVERMKWEEERVGCDGVDEKEVKVKRAEEYGGEDTGWRRFGCFVLVERFVFKRMDGSIVLAYDFKHTHQIRCKWE